MEREYLINDYFSDGEMWAILTSLDAITEEMWLTEEQYELVISAKDKILSRE